MTADSGFWRGRCVLLTGHTGFKGGWMAVRLAALGAQVTGLALEPEPGPSLFDKAHLADLLDHHVVDLRDQAGVARLVAQADPEIVLHMAAQPLVLRSYRDPVETFATNVQGTVHLLEALRGAPSVKTVLVITSDKVYADDGSGRPHGEDDRLGGRDPYSASKAMTEIAVASYARSFFGPRGVVVATARGGNVIGGGDFAADRILPDAWRAVRAGKPLVLRNPDAVRPWQHVLDCVAAYLVYAEQLASKPDAPRTLNFGPDDEGVRVEELARAFLRELGAEAAIRVEPNPAAVETHHLALDTRAAERALGWRGRLSALDAATWTAEWYRRVDEGEDALAVTREQIGRHAEL